MDRKIGGYGRHRKHGYRKVCARQAPKTPITEHKSAQKKVCEELQRSEKEGDAFLSRIVTGGET